MMEQGTFWIGLGIGIAAGALLEWIRLRPLRSRMARLEWLLGGGGKTNDLPSRGDVIEVKRQRPKLDSMWGDLSNQGKRPQDI